MSLNFQMSDLQYFDNNEWFQYAYCINSYTDLGLVVGKVSKPIMPQVQESVQDVPGMYGNIFTGNDYGELTFTIPVTIMAFDHTSYNIICENLRHMFTADSYDPGSEYPLVFGDQPGVKYYGHWGQMSDPTFITPNDWQASATLTFICSQPFGYLDQQSMTVNYPDQPIFAQGNTTTYPVYTIHLNKDIYNVGFSKVGDNEDYVATGYTVDAENTDDEGNRLQDNEPLDTDEEPTTLSDWIQGMGNLSYLIDGDQAGKMGERSGSTGITPALTTHTDQNRPKGQQKQQVRDFGNPKNHGHKYYGPLATHPQFNNPTSDWRLMVNLWNQKTSTDHLSDRAQGMCNIYLLDENGHRRGRIFIHDMPDGRWPRVGFELGAGTKSDPTVEMLNYNNWQTDNNGPTGPTVLGNTDVKLDRQPKPQRFKIKSLWSYKQLVKDAQKNKKGKVRKAIKNNKKINARTRRRKAVTRRSGRHVPHNYPAHRHSSKGKIHRKKR